jgi:hypothetical protein
LKALPVENLTVIAGGDLDGLAGQGPRSDREAASELVGSIGPIGRPSITRRQRQ